jgi:Protein of unknown function (DUF2752)
MTRAFHALVRGNLFTAADYNILSPVVFSIFALVLLADVIQLATGRRVIPRVPGRLEQTAGFAALFVVMAYGVARNVTWLP